MIQPTFGVSALLQRASVRPPADTLELELCQRCLPAPVPLALYVHTNGAAIGRVDILPLRRLMLAQQPESPLERPHGATIFATGPDNAIFFIDTTNTCGAGAGTVWGMSPTEPEPQLVALHLDDFLVAVVSEEIDPWPQSSQPRPHTPVGQALPERHGATYANRLADALRYLPGARASARYALRRAVSLKTPARERMLASLGDTLSEQLPGAYSRDIVTDHMMDRVIQHMVEPFLGKLRQNQGGPAPTVLTHQLHQLREALLVGSLGDLGEFFCEENEHHLYGFISHYLALLELRDREGPLDPVEVEVHLQTMDVHLSSLRSSPDDLLASLPRTPYRDGAARDILEPLGYAWLVDHAME